jgi:hypothetical protein
MNIWQKTKLLVATLTTCGLTLSIPSHAMAQQEYVESQMGEGASSLCDLESRIRALEAGCYRNKVATDGKQGLIVWGDYLLWSVRNPGFEYGISQTAPQVQDGGPIGNIETLRPDYAPGFRVGLGKRLGGYCDGPELIGGYTWFKNNITRVNGPGRATLISSDNAVNTDQDIDVDTPFVFPQPQNVTPEDFYDSVAARYQFKYQAIDAALSQNLKMTDSLTLRVIGGGRGVFINELREATYTGGDFLVPLTASQKNAFNGGGLLSGLETRWNITNRLRFNIGSNVGLLLGRSRSQTVIPDSPDITIAPAHILTTPTNVFIRTSRIVPMLELNVGTDYVRSFKKTSFNIGAGYQMVNYFNASDTRTFSDAFQEGQNSNSLNSISLDGLYVRSGFNF